MNASLSMWRTFAMQFWQRSPGPRFWRWWWSELAGMLPASIKAWFSTGIEWHVIEQVEAQWQWRAPHAVAPVAYWNDAMTQAQRQAVIRQVLAGLSHGAPRIALLVPDAWVLRRRMTFPLAARDRLKQVATYEIDRQTPFRANDVFHEMGDVTVGAKGAQLSTTLLVVPRALLDPLLVELREFGVVLDAVDVREGHGRMGVNLLPMADVPRRVSRRQQVNLTLLAGAVLLLVLSMLQWIHNREAALRFMRDDVARMQTETRDVSALRQELQDRAGATGFLAERKKRQASALAILQELSARLPSQAWLERLSIDNAGQVGMQGQGAQAASLLEALKGSAWLAEPAFQGSIQKDPATGKERFYMVAQLRKPADAKPKAAPATAGSAP